MIARYTTIFNLYGNRGKGSRELKATITQQTVVVRYQDPKT